MRMRCLECGSEAVTERPERTAQGYRRFRTRTAARVAVFESIEVFYNRQRLPCGSTVKTSPLPDVS